MMLIKRSKIKFLLLLSILFASKSIYAQTDLNEIIAGTDIGDKVIFSGQGEIAFEYTRIDSLSEKAVEEDLLTISKASPDEIAVIRNHVNTKLSFAFSGRKFYCQEISLGLHPSGKLYTQNWQWAYNGEKLDLLRLDGLGENGLIIPFGSVRTNNAFPVEDFDPRYYGMNIMGTPVSSFLSSSSETKTIENLQIIEEEMLDDINCIILSGNINKTDEMIKVWLAPKIMFRPKKIEIRSSDRLIVIQNTFREYNPGIWFPEQMIKNEYYIDSSNGKEILYEQYKLSIQNDYKLNIELPDNLFEIEFPAGMSIYDYRIGEKRDIK